MFGVCGEDYNLRIYITVEGNNSAMCMRITVYFGEYFEISVEISRSISGEISKISVEISARAYTSGDIARVGLKGGTVNEAPGTETFGQFRTTKLLAVGYYVKVLRYVFLTL